MPLTIFQKGFNYSQDGRGNRLVYHLQGCNMRCPWCSNPEGMFSENPLCTKQKPLLKYQTQDILKEALSCKLMFFDGGGVTFTGGEPTLQFSALAEALHALKANGIHTAIESNASHPNLPSLFPSIDQLIMDFKHWDDKMHCAITGISNDVIKKNLAEALEKHKDTLIRTVLVRGVNDTEQDAENFAAFYRQFNTEHARFEFLAYHEYGKAKWEQCGRKYNIQNAFIQREVVEMYQKIYRENGLHVVQT